MKNDEIGKTVNNDFLQSVSDVLAQARKNAKTAVNLSMVYAYYEIGRMIVEEEQHGENRAAYGKQLLRELSAYLTGTFGKGYSAENLKLMRRFYTVYSHDQIGETVFTQLMLSKDYAQILRANTKLFCLKKKICKSCWRNSYPRTGVKTIEAAI